MRFIELSLCRGAKTGVCPYALPLDPALIAAVEALVAARGDALVSPEAQFPKSHERFRVRLSSCANGCSSPHTGDVGLIVAARPEFLPERCTGCAACVRACPDGTIRLYEPGLEPAPATAATTSTDGRLRCLECSPCVGACPDAAYAHPGTIKIDRSRCLDCGRCVRACPSHALVLGGSGLRVLVAGRLGRRPQLAAELPGLLDPLSFPALFTRMLDMLGETPGAKRLADWGTQTDVMERLA